MEVLFSHYSVIDREGFGRSFMLARELVVTGNKITFLTTQPSNKFIFPFRKEIRDGVVIYAFPDIVPGFMRRTGFGFLSFFLKLLFILFNRFDIYHADAGHRVNGGLPILFKKFFLKDIIYITEWWDYFGKGGKYDRRAGIKKYTIGFYDILFEVMDKKYADGVVCLSSRMARTARKIGLKDNKIKVITGGSDPSGIKFYISTDLRNRYNLNTSNLVFGFVGMDQEEFFDILPFIYAVNELKKQSIHVNWFTTGKRISGDLKDKFNIGKELTEFGWLDYSNFSEILSCADIFILLQRENLENYLRWPNKIGDYIAAGRPILINPFGDTKNLVSQHNDFFYIVDYSAKSIVSKIKEIKAINHKAKRRAIRRFAETEFNWKSKSIELLNFYGFLRKLNSKNSVLNF